LVVVGGRVVRGAGIVLDGVEVVVVLGAWLEARRVMLHAPTRSSWPSTTAVMLTR